MNLRWLQSPKSIRRTGARAHSFLLQSRLAISLAWVAGFVNVVAVMVCGTVVSHVTGHASLLGKSVGDGAWPALLVPSALLSAFFFGALASGFAIEFGRQRGWASLYVLPATLELTLLIAFALVEGFSSLSQSVDGAMSPTVWCLVLLASLAMGLQNATITRISSGVIRTTHLTGVVTDLGHESAQLALLRWRFKVRSKPDLSRDRLDEGAIHHDGPSFQRLILLATIALSFMLGSAGGALSERYLGHAGMLPPILLLVWIVIADLRTPICAIESAMLAPTECGQSDVALYRAIPRGSTGTETHFPNLVRWVDELPRSTRAVVLDLSAVHVLGPLGASALEGLHTAASRRGIQVCIAGIDSVDASTVNALTRANLLHEGNFAKEVAVALKLVTNSRDHNA